MKSEHRPLVPYIPGTAESIGPSRHRSISPYAGDTCFVVGGSSFQDDKFIRTMWPSLTSSIPVALPFDAPFFKKNNINVEMVKPQFLPLTLNDSVLTRADGIRYKGIGKNDLPHLKKVYKECFGYPIAEDELLALFTQTGGHLGGIFEEDMMIGFTTILAAHLLTENHEQALFVDSVGIIPEKRNLRLGSFALQAVEQAAREKNISYIALTHKPDLVGFYEKNGFRDISWFENLYGPGEHRHYAVKQLDQAL
jgi:ribosomal protein S18 acetylase RimI-like enzyme